VTGGLFRTGRSLLLALLIRGSVGGVCALFLTSLDYVTGRRELALKDAPALVFSLPFLECLRSNSTAFRE
jgi:hypothetical protein